MPLSAINAKKKNQKGPDKQKLRISTGFDPFRTDLRQRLNESGVNERKIKLKKTSLVRYSPARPHTLPAVWK